MRTETALVRCRGDGALMQSHCLWCREPDKEEIAPFNRTDGIQCQCKPGTFQDENSPEMCQRCSLGCPVGKVMAKPCTPRNDIVCVDQESSTQARGETPVPGEPVTTTWNLSTSPSPSTDSPSPVSTSVVTVIVVVAVVVAVAVVVVVKLFLPRCRVCCICQGSGVATSCRNRVNWFLQHLVASFRRVFRYLCASGGPEALDNARNMIVNSRDSLPTSASEQELEQREHAGLPGVTVQTPGEAEHLLA